ncbi:MAG TPA: hypothetical protein VIN03_13590 [Roseateles sp.]
MTSISRTPPPTPPLDSVDQLGTGLLAGNPLLASNGPLQPVDNLWLPEPLEDSVAGLLPETGLSLLQSLPLTYRFDPTWRRNTYESSVRLENLILSAEQQADLTRRLLEPTVREGRKQPSLTDRGEDPLKPPGEEAPSSGTAALRERESRQRHRGGAAD